MIRHVWFDVEGTLTLRKPGFDAIYDAFRYGVYAEVTGRPLSDELKREFDAQYNQHATTSAVFTALGRPSNFWQTRYETLDLAVLYDRSEAIPRTLDRLRRVVPISCFTNLAQAGIEASLRFVGAEKDLFAYLLSGDEVDERKPALAGFLKMIELSGLPPDQLMYVGDRVKVDIRPANEVSMQTCLIGSESQEATYSLRRFEDLLTLFPKA